MKKHLPLGFILYCLTSTGNALHQINLEYDAYVLDARDKLTDFMLRPASFDYVKVGTLNISIQYHGMMHTAQLTAIKQSEYQTSTFDPGKPTEENTSLTQMLGTLAIWTLNKASEALTGTDSSVPSQPVVMTNSRFVDVASMDNAILKMKHLTGTNTLVDFFIYSPKHSEWYQTEIELMQLGLPQLSSKMLCFTFPGSPPLCRQYKARSKENKDDKSPEATRPGWHDLSKTYELPTHGLGGATLMHDTELFVFQQDAIQRVKPRTRDSLETWTPTPPKVIIGLPGLFQQTALSLAGKVTVTGWFPEWVPTPSLHSCDYLLASAHPSIAGDGLHTHHDFISYTAIQNPLLHEQGKIYSSQTSPWKLIILPWGNKLQIVLLSRHFDSNKPITVESAPEPAIDDTLLKEALDGKD
ncbi:MAG: hypothetical protein ACR2PX_07385 [Endozoicomonas sp.]|uniref:hypothetical protein n=1 Tax=Endozoicomonas sp. TaxID=1892382 RepID=UPI003D9AE0B0